jgi:hypothetical protein
MMTHIFWQTGKLSTNWEESRCNLDAFHNPHACRVISVLTRSNLHLDLGIKPFTLPPPRHILILEFHLHVLERWNCWNPVKNTKIHRPPSPCQERHGHLPGHPKFEVEDQKPPSEIPAGTARSGRSTVNCRNLWLERINLSQNNPRVNWQTQIDFGKQRFSLKGLVHTLCFLDVVVMSDCKAENNSLQTYCALVARWPRTASVFHCSFLTSVDLGFLRVTNADGKLYPVTQLVRPKPMLHAILVL